MLDVEAQKAESTEALPMSEDPVEANVELLKVLQLSVERLEVLLPSTIKV